MAAAWACSVEIGGSVKSHAVVIGMGYVGLPLAMNLVESGLSVAGYDTDAGVLESLNAGSSHVDDVKDDAVGRALQRGFRASSDPSDKPDVAECRETPAVPIARRLADWGTAVRFHDPLVESWSPCPGGEPALQRVDDVYLAAAEADLVVLLQPHAEYDLERLAGFSVLLLDTSGRVQQCTAAVQRL